MRTTFALSVAALAGRVFSAPVEAVQVDVVVETQLETVYVTEEYVAPTPAVVYEEYSAPTPAAVYEEYSVVTAVYEAPVVYTVVYDQPAAPTTTSARRTRTRTHKAPAATPDAGYNAVYSPAPVYGEVTSSVAPAPVYGEVTSSVAPAPAPTSSSAAAPAPSAPATDSGYMAVVDTWRSKLGMTALAYDATLEANAKDCVVASAGEMKHKLNTGSYGQVLAPGTADNFEHVFLGGWLCERPSLPGLDGACEEASEGWSYQGQTGHADILTSPNYSKIGCALATGIWACDLA